jgi:regulator of replication initiation timing
LPYPAEHSCRLLDPDEVNVVGSGEREHDGRTYRVIYGKPKGGDGSVEQAYRYPKDTWSEPDARAHCMAHKGILFEPARGQASGEGIEIRFWAAVHSIETGREGCLATFYIMNTSLNRNGWMVTDKALEDAYPGLLDKPLNCVPGYRVNHVHEPLQVGRFVKTEKPDGYALATAEITDPVAWEKLNSGDWGPVSVVIRAFRVTCSKCGADITADPDEHIKVGEGHEVIESFVFDRIDFVAEPAYPQAGLLNIGLVAESDGGLVKVYQASVVSFEETVKAPEERAWDADAAEARVRGWAGGPDKEKVDWGKYRRAFAWYDSEDPENFSSYKLMHHDIVDGRLHVIWKGVVAAMQVTLGARDGVDVPQSEHRGVYNHLARHYRQFEKETPPYHVSQSITGQASGSLGGSPNPEEEMKNRMEAQLAQIKQELEQVKTEKNTLKTENDQLKGRVKALEDERHQERVDATLEARAKADLVKDRQAEATRLKELDDKTLDLLREDAEKVAEKMAKAPPTGPKTKFTKDDKSAFEAAVEGKREEFFGYRRDAQGKVVV